MGGPTSRRLPPAQAFTRPRPSPAAAAAPAPQPLGQQAGSAALRGRRRCCPAPPLPAPRPHLLQGLGHGGGDDGPLDAALLALPVALLVLPVLRLAFLRLGHAPRRAERRQAEAAPARGRAPPSPALAPGGSGRARARRRPSGRYRGGSASPQRPRRLSLSRAASDRLGETAAAPASAPRGRAAVSGEPGEHLRRSGLRQVPANPLSWAVG